MPSIHSVARVLAVCVTSSLATEVYVMLPLDTVTNDGALKDQTGLGSQLDKMKSANVDGFMVDVWWGLTEPTQKKYKFDVYQQLVDMAKSKGMKVQMVASFHECGGNVGDTCNIPVPSFVRETKGIWYKDQFGNEDKEYVSLFADNSKVGGRTPLEMYADWLKAFGANFKDDLGSTILEIQVGMGPAGELRYPAYQLAHWKFCGVGAFQAFDENALSSLKAAAVAAGHPEWGTPPTNAGNYNSQPGDAEFFQTGYKSPSGKFFLDWYFSSLKTHAAAVLSSARDALGTKVRIAGKIAGIHWWFNSPHHAAELTSGYYQADGRNAYAELSEVFTKSGGAGFDFTCLEMRDREQSDKCASGPEELVRTVMFAAQEFGRNFAGENALPRYDTTAYNQIERYRSNLTSFTYLRLGNDLVADTNKNYGNFKDFVNHMHNGESKSIVV